MTDCRIHLAIYSKLIKGNDPDGPIKQGTEARIIGKSKDFPDELVGLCRPTFFFKDAPNIMSIDPRHRVGGVFVYKPFYLNSRHYSAFARIEARPEDGVGMLGRRYTHCAVLFIEDKWEPDLIPWAARKLFDIDDVDRCWGDPVCEGQKDRLELELSSFSRSDLFSDQVDQPTPFERDAAGQFFSRRRMPQWTEVDKDAVFVDLAHLTSKFLHDNALAVHGRWLSFAFGTTQQVVGLNTDFFFRLDDRDASEDGRGLKLNFSDMAPPHVFGDIRPSNVLEFSWEALRPEPKSVRASILKPENFWPDQLAASGISPNGSQHIEPRQSPAPQTGEHTHLRRFIPQGAPEAFAAQESSEIQIDFPDYFNSDLNRLCSPQKIAKIRPAFQHLVAKLNILKDPDFSVYYATPDDEKYIDALETLFWTIMVYTLGRDPSKLRPVLEALLYHDAIPAIGMPAGSRGGLLQQSLSAVIDDIGFDKLAEWLERHGRLELALKYAAVGARKADPGRLVHVPQPQQLKALLDWLDELKPIDTETGALTSFGVLWQPAIEALAGKIADTLKPDWEK